MSQPPPAGFGLIRRSATLPTKLMTEKRPFRDVSPNQKEYDSALFFHPSAKIVKFAPDAPPATPQSAPSADFDYPVDTIETLPWQSPTERTVAVGRLRLEMVPGLSPFLKCGTVVQAILKNSQCWCVDGKSTFVLRIRSLTYYRIELPNKTPEDEALIEQFKSALAKVLRYEVTPCPFQRGFSVPLPEAHLPKKKRAWRPKSRRESAPALSGPDNTLNTNTGLETSPKQPRSAEASDGEATDDSASTTTNSISQPEPVSGDLGLYSTTQDTSSSDERPVAEPASSVHDILARFQPIPESDSEDEPESDSLDDAESFYSLLIPDTTSPPSPSYTSPPTSPLDTQVQDFQLNQRRSHGHNRDISAATVTPDTFSSPAIEITSAVERFEESPEVREKRKASSDYIASSVPSDSDFSDARTGSATGVETFSACLDKGVNRSLSMRRGHQSSRKRDFSPMPPASTLEYPSLRASKTQLTTTVFRKTCALVLIPPIQLLLVLIQIAARIVAGHALQPAVLNVTHKRDTEEDDTDFQMPKTPGTYRRSLLLGDPSDSLSDLE